MTNATPTAEQPTPDRATPPASRAPARGSTEAVDGTGRIQSVERAARILLAFGTPDQRVTVAELARMLGVHKSTASRIVATLVTFGLLERGADDDQLALGPELARLGRLAATGPDLSELAAPAMEDLSAATGESTTLAVADGASARTLTQCDGRYVIGMQDWTGRLSPLHATSDGKVLLAFGAASLAGTDLPAITAATHSDPAQLLDELATIRTTGWAASLGEFELGLHGVAAPVFDASGTCRAALCISGPAYRMTAEALPELGQLCRQAADRISAAFSFDGARSPTPTTPTAI